MGGRACGGELMPCVVRLCLSAPCVSSAEVQKVLEGGVNGGARKGSVSSSQEKEQREGGHLAQD